MANSSYRHMIALKSSSSRMTRVLGSRTASARAAQPCRWDTSPDSVWNWTFFFLPGSRYEGRCSWARDETPRLASAAAGGSGVLDRQCEGHRRSLPVQRHGAAATCEGSDYYCLQQCCMCTGRMQQCLGEAFERQLSGCKRHGGASCTAFWHLSCLLLEANMHTSLPSHASSTAHKRPLPELGNE